MHVSLLYGMDRGLVIRLKWSYKVDRCLFLIKHRTKKITFNLLVQAAHSKLVLMKVYVAFKSLCFQKYKKEKRPVKTRIPGDQVSQNVFVSISSKFCIKDNFIASTWHGLVSETIHLRLRISSKLSHHTETKQKIK